MIRFILFCSFYRFIVSLPANTDATAAKKKDRTTAGPATYLDSAPGSTYTPTPMVLPTPNAVRSVVVSTLSNIEVSRTTTAIVFFRLNIFPTVMMPAHRLRGKHRSSSWNYVHGSVHVRCVHSGVVECRRWPLPRPTATQHAVHRTRARSYTATSAGREVNGYVVNVATGRVRRMNWTHQTRGRSMCIIFIIYITESTAEEATEITKSKRFRFE